MPVITIWTPNGFGAGTDNLVVGGGGGFMALPQPPADATGKFLSGLPEDNGQFGILDYRTNFNALGVDFRLSNPGRNVNQ